MSSKTKDYIDKGNARLNKKLTQLFPVKTKMEVVAVRPRSHKKSIPYAPCWNLEFDGFHCKFPNNNKNAGVARSRQVVSVRIMYRRNWTLDMMGVCFGKRAVK